MKIELDEENEKKVIKVSLDTGLPYKAIVNLFMKSVTNFELQNIVTFDVDDKASNSPKSPGPRSRIRRRFSVMRDL